MLESDDKANWALPKPTRVLPLKDVDKASYTGPETFSIAPLRKPEPLHLKRLQKQPNPAQGLLQVLNGIAVGNPDKPFPAGAEGVSRHGGHPRSEERRVGKECM